jgi:hypothetical protein
LSRPCYGTRRKYHSPTCYGSAYSASGRLPATSCQIKCNMVMSGTSVDSYRRRHSWHSLVFLPLPVFGSGIARARESRRTNFARSLCGRFRGRSIAYNCNTAFLPRTFGLARLFRLVSHANGRWLWLIWLPYLSVACPCNEAVRYRKWREVRVRHTVVC